MASLPVWGPLVLSELLNSIRHQPEMSLSKMHPQLRLITSSQEATLSLASFSFLNDDEQVEEGKKSREKQLRPPPKAQASHTLPDPDLRVAPFHPFLCSLIDDAS